MIGENPQPPGDAENPEEASASEGRARPGNGEGGFVPPSQRDWVHPSEFLAISKTLESSSKPSHRHRRRTAIVSIAATVVLVGGILVLAHPTSNSTTTTSVLPAQQISSAPQPIQSSAPSLVAVNVSSNGSSTTTCGVVLDASHVATTAGIPMSRSVRVMTSSGQQEDARVTQVDETAGVTVLTVVSPLTASSPPTISTAPAGTMTAVKMASSSGSSNVAWSSAHLETPSAAATHHNLVFDTMRVSNSFSSVPGSVVINKFGEVVGIAAPQIGSHVYLPLAFVMSVATRLMTTTAPHHGWLKITGTDSPRGIGATVTHVNSDSPAKGLVLEGDTITSVNSKHVATMAALVDDLYTMDVGESAKLTVLHQGSSRVVAVSLSDAP